MAGKTVHKSPPRLPLSRERVLRAAVVLADENGVDALSMRRLGQELGVKAMSLYNHVSNKDDVLDGMVDVVASEFKLAHGGADWKAAIRGSALSAHKVLLRHPWTCGLIFSRPTVGPARLRHGDAVLGSLRGAGFSIQLAHHASHLLDNHIYGFTLQELSYPASLEGFGEEVSAILLQQKRDAYPHITEIVTQATHDHQAEFEFGLDLTLDSLERVRDKAQPEG